MRLGGNIYDEAATPEDWVAAVKKASWRAAYCPLKPDADDATVAAYAKAAADADIVIAEVGAPVQSDRRRRRRAQEEHRQVSDPPGPGRTDRREVLRQRRRLAGRRLARTELRHRDVRPHRRDGPSDHRCRQPDAAPSTRSKPSRRSSPTQPMNTST